MRRVFLLILALFVVLTAVTACGSKEKSREKAAAPRAELANEPGSEEDYIADEAGAGSPVASKSEAGKDISFVFLAPNKFSGERYLEYQVSLYYETRNFELSRKDLLDIVSQNGFLAYTTAGYENLRYSMTAQLNIKVAELYNVLKLLDRVGSLRSENISVVDLTRDMAWNVRKSRRLKVRSDRIAKALGEVAAGNKNWQSREDALERSEDALDQSEQGQWDVLDRIAWAKITVTVAGPKDVQPVEIPTFRNALTMVVNGLFKVLYVLIILIPFAALGWVIWWQRKNIKGLFTRKREK